MLGGLWWVRWGAVGDADADELGPLGAQAGVEGVTVEPGQGEVGDEAVEWRGGGAVLGDEECVACAAGFDHVVACACEESANGRAPVFGLHDE